MDDELLISAVFEREALWDPANESHRNVNILRALWVEVAQIVNKPVRVTKSRWKNVRQYFYTVDEKQTTNEQDGAAPAPVTWQLYNQLSFLKKINASLASDSSSNFKEVNVPAFSDYGESSLQDPLALDVQSPLTPDSNSNSEPLQNRNYSEENLDPDRSELLQLKRRKIELLEREIQQKVKSDDLLFFESLLPYMAQIPAMPKLKLRSAIQDLIFKHLKPKQENNYS